MAKVRTLFVCQNCGAQFPKWEGRCRDCGAWNSLVEEAPVSEPRGWTRGEKKHKSEAVTLDQELQAVSAPRISTALGEFDRVLGGGLVAGSYVLLGGDPGIGKSTLLLQMAGGLAQNEKQVLYVSGEESLQQTALRAQRLGVRHQNIAVAAESVLENIIALAGQRRPDVLVVDSIQTVYASDIASAPGSVSQVRECASRLMTLAKSQDMAIFLIGHVTKEGHIAGPKVLEHMVDTVLAFEGDNNHQYRLLRALKNRFGPSNELGVFHMDSLGLKEVENPSELFLEERGPELTGSAIYCAMEGSRPLLCEVQALCTSSPLAMPRRTSLGFDTNRVHLLAAVLDKHIDVQLGRYDVFVNVVGGLKLSEPAADLAVAAALISSANDHEVPAKMALFGEIGLTGEIRAANFVEERLREAKKLGFEKVVLPTSNRKHLGNHKNDLELIFLRTVSEIPNVLKNLRATSRPSSSRASTQGRPSPAAREKA